MALQFTEREFIPVLLGGDINAYSVARAFYEEYQVKSLVFGKYHTGPAYRSQIIDYTPECGYRYHAGHDRDRQRHCAGQSR